MKGLALLIAAGWLAAGCTPKNSTSGNRNRLIFCEKARYAPDSIDRIQMRKRTTFKVADNSDPDTLILYIYTHNRVCFGPLVNEQRAGRWECYDSTGAPVAFYLYDNGRRLFTCDCIRNRAYPEDAPADAP